VHGAFLHGLAGALYEELIYSNDGQLLTSTFVDYLSPSSVESFSPRVGHIESPSPFTLLGAKGGGEGSSETTPAALANAIADALSLLGIEIRELPLPPEKIWMMIKQREE
jgi:CO/xanthine dehydrogenase Mo-binding subunit